MSRIGATKTVTQATNPHTAATRRNFRRDFISGNGIARRKKDKRAADVLCLRPASLIAFALWVLTNYESSYYAVSLQCIRSYLLVAQKDAETVKLGA